MKISLLFLCTFFKPQTQKRFGDIVGSIYEWNNITTKDFPPFSPGCFFTDDTVMTLAMAEGLINGGSTEDFIKQVKPLAYGYHI